MWSYWIGGGGTKCNITGVLIKRREFVQRETYTKEADGERDCGDAATSQGKPGATRRVRKRSSPGGFSGSLALLTPGIWTSSFKIGDTIILVV